MSVKNIHILWKLYLFEWVIEDWIGILHRIFSVEKNHLILAVKNLLFLENLCSLRRIFQHLRLTYWHWNNSIMIWLIENGFLQRSVVVLQLPWLSPQLRMTSIVEGANETLGKRKETCWRHGLLLKVAYKSLEFHSCTYINDMVSLNSVPVNYKTTNPYILLTFMVIFFQSPKSDQEEY